MFHLAHIADVIAVQPAHFGLPRHQAITSAINAKYANRVLSDHGLCVALFDLTEVEEGRVRGGDGALFHRSTFRLVMFRPFISEILTGRVKSCDKDGLRISLGFFDDIFVPAHLLPTPSAYDFKEKLFFWVFELDETANGDALFSTVDQRMYIDIGETVRVCVEEEVFEESEPGPIIGATAAGAGGLPGAVVAAQAEKVEDGTRVAPYRITCGMASAGLGVTSWWEGAAVVGGEEDGYEEMQE